MAYFFGATLYISTCLYQLFSSRKRVLCALYSDLYSLVGYFAIVHTIFTSIFATSTYETLLPQPNIFTSFLPVKISKSYTSTARVAQKVSHYRIMIKSYFNFSKKIDFFSKYLTSNEEGWYNT